MLYTHQPLHPPGRNAQVSTLGWELKPVPAPDVTDSDTVLGLAKMTNNAYAHEGDKDWYELDGHWNVRALFLFLPQLISLVHLA
jgi:putative lipase involved disintegration of autophagic bodies